MNRTTPTTTNQQPTAGPVFTTTPVELKALISYLQRALATGTVTIPHSELPPIPPETFRLPKRGVDPHFGCSRPFYYQLEKAGRIRLIRIRGRGKQRGVTLVPYDQMKRLVEEAAEQ